jgi:hypothetical protein
VRSYSRLFDPRLTFRGVIYIDVAKQAGIRFVHDNAASSEKYLFATVGGGAGWLDYNYDGHQDLYLVDSAKAKGLLRNAMYRNNGDGTFSDVTKETATDGDGVFGMGLAVGDFDNDGSQDLYITGYDRSVLYKNRRNRYLSKRNLAGRCREPRQVGLECRMVRL